jgi:hypothetical protein
MKYLAIAAFSVLAFVACGGDNSDRTNTIPADICNWETELWDGEQCLLRTDHEGHMGNH